MAEIDMPKTGARIKEHCRMAGISVKDIQRELFIGSFQSVYAWFHGKSLPSIDNLYRLSHLLDVKVDDLIVPVVKEYWIELCKDKSPATKSVLVDYVRMMRRLWETDHSVLN
ncbi:MAG: helix-turn-helix transcriptional regulator [Lachnospiraceae bacterium]|nr:helix-turn-helix transcriptional regulator [Lachnospiraceae bacterium]